MASVTTIDANGARVPALGFGTYRLVGDDCRRMVEAALALGYRHIDTATVYDNESSVGDALARTATPRDQVFLTTKVWVDSYRADAFERSVAASLERLKTDYVDLLLLHWPSRTVPLAEVIGSLNAARRRGMTRHIGLSNFTTGLVDEAAALSDAPLATNQVEYHAFLEQSAVKGVLERHGMALTAYSPLAEGRVASSDLLVRLGERHGKTAFQVGLRWLVQQPGVAAVPKTLSETRAAANLEIFDFELTDDEMRQIHAHSRVNARICSPDHLAPEWDA